MDLVTIKQPLCAIYARVSTDIQEDSVAHQVSLMREFARAKGLGVVPDEFIYEDVGVSATKHSIWTRPAMKRLLADAEQGKFQTVLFKGISRFARSTQEALNVLEMLKSKGLRVISYEENYDSAQENSNFLFTIHSAVAEYEAEKLGIRVRLGRKEAAKEGKWVGKVPVGYRMGDDGRLVIHEEEAKFVRQVFDMYVNQGIGSARIAHYMSEHKALGKMWSRDVIVGILKNEVYIGNIVFNRYRNKQVMDYDANEIGKKKTKRIPNSPDDWVVAEGVHEPIIDKTTFLQAQKILASRRKQDPEYKAKYPLTGLLRCKRCGATLNGHVTSKRKNGKIVRWRYYMCQSVKSYGRSACNQPQIRKEKLDSVIIDQVKKKLAQYVAKNEEASINLIRNNLDKLKDELKKVDQKIDLVNKKTADLYFEKDNMTEQQYGYVSTRLKEEMERLLLRKVELEEEIKSSEEGQELAKRVEQDIHDFLKEVEENEMDEERIRVLLHRLIERIFVDGNKLEIKYRFQF